MGYIDKVREKLQKEKRIRNKEKLPIVSEQAEIQGENKNINLTSIEEILNEKYFFKPDIQMGEYLEYAEDNYNSLLIKAKKYYQELLKNDTLTYDYFHKLLEWSQEPYLSDKEKYYQRIFMVEYIEFKHFNRGKTFNFEYVRGKHEQTGN